MRDWDTWEFAAVEVLDDAPSCVYPCRCGRCGAEWENADDDVGSCPACASKQVLMSAPVRLPPRVPALNCARCKRVYVHHVVGVQVRHVWAACLCGAVL